MTDELKIPQRLEIDQIDTLKVLSDPLRLDILKQVGIYNKKGRRCTVKQIAKLLSMPPTKLYYHVNLLEEHELLVVGETQIVSGIIEKHYQVAAMTISVNKDILTMNEGDRSEQLAKIFDSIKEVVENALMNLQSSLGTIFEEIEHAESSDTPDREKISLDVRNNEFLLTRDQAREMIRQLNAVQEEYDQVSDRNIAEENGESLFFGVTQLIAPYYHRKSVESPPKEIDSSDQIE